MVAFSGQNLICVRRQLIIFENLSFSLENGQMMALTGPNGSGKTSLLRMMAGLLPPADGLLSWDDEEIEPDMLPGKIHWIGPENPLKPALSLSENLKFWASMMGVSDDEKNITAALDQLGMAHLAATRAQYMSFGQLRRASLCRLFLAPRPLWLLDEPATGLDQNSAEILKNLSHRHVQQEGMVIVATHRPAFWQPHIQYDLQAGAA